MRNPTSNYQAASVQRHQRPVYIILVIDKNKTVSFTSSTLAINGEPGDQVFRGVIDSKGLKSTSQTLNIEKGSATVGGFSFDVADHDHAISDLLRNLYLDKNSINAARVIFYRGFAGLDFPDFLQLGAFIVTSLKQAPNKLSFSCSDPTRFATSEIFTVIDGSLIDPIDPNFKSGWRRVNADVSQLALIAYDHSIDDGLSAKPCGFLKFGSGENVEIIRYTEIDFEQSRLYIEARSQFQTVPGDWIGEETDPETQEVEAGEDFSEWFYIRMNAVKIAYALYTGETLGIIGSKWPDKLHAGVTSEFISADSFLNIGLDLYDPNDDKAGPILEFYGLADVSAQSMNALEVGGPIGLYFSVNSHGEIEANRDPIAFPGMGGDMLIDSRNIIKVSSVTRDPARVSNVVNVKFSHDWKTDEYTRSNAYIFSDSVAQYGRTNPKTLSYKGLQLNYALDPLLKRINKVAIDRYSEEVITVSVNTLPSTHLLEIGDTVYLDANYLPDWGSNTPVLTRSMLITKASSNWLTGQVSLTMESLIKAPNDLGKPGDPSFTEAFYSQGTLITDLLDPACFEDDGGILLIKKSCTLEGMDNMHDQIAHWLGDIIIESGVTLTITKNVQIRTYGALSIQGKISGIGKGWEKWQMPVSGDHYIGPGLIFSQLGVRGWFGDDGEATPAVTERPVHDAGTPRARRLDISITGISDDNFEDMIPDSLRGGNGPIGGESIAFDWDYTLDPPNRNERTLAGSNGGIGGSGLLVVARNGFIKGPNAIIDLSGDDGEAGNKTNLVASWLQDESINKILNTVMLSGAGGGGGCGCCLMLTESAITDDLSRSFTTKYGRVNSPNFDVVGTVAGEMSAEDFNEADILHAFELGYPGNKARDFSDAAFAMYLANKTVIYEKPKTEIPKPLDRVEAYVIGNTPPTAGKSRATVVINAIADPLDKNYRYSQFAYKREGFSSWLPLQNVANSEAQLEIPADGATWDFLAYPTNLKGESNPDGATISVTAPSNSINTVTIKSLDITEIKVDIYPATCLASWVPVGAGDFPDEPVFYEVQHRAGSAGEYNAVGNTADVTIKVSGIVNGVNTVRVRAIPPNGKTSQWFVKSFNSEIARSPKDLAFTESSDSIYWGLLTWSADAPIYEVRIIGKDNEIMFATSTTSREAIIQQLDPGNYSIQVRSRSGETVSTWSSINRSVGIISPPINVSFSFQPKNAVSAGVLGWDCDDDRVSSYEIQVETEDGVNVAALASNSSSTPLPFLIPGGYIAKVRGLWRSFSSSYAEKTINISVDADEPTALKFTASNEPGSVGLLTWSGSASYYDVKVLDAQDTPIVETGVASTSYKIGTLSPGSYKAQVRAKGTFGASAWVSINIIVSVPSKPLNLLFSSDVDIYGQDGILTWEKPPQSVAGYAVEIVGAGNKIAISDTTTGTSYGIAGLSSAPYTARVYSLAPITEQRSTPSTVNFTIAELNTPTSLSAIEELTKSGATWSSSAALSWKKGDDRSEAFEVEYRLLTAPTWSGGYTGASNSAKINNLSIGEYVFRVRSVAGGLYSGWAEVSLAIRGYDEPPPDVSDFQLRALSGQFAMLTWSQIGDVEVAGGGSIQIRHTFKSGAGATWESAAALTEKLPGNATFVSVPLLAGTYLIKAQSVRGTWSVTAVALFSNMDSMLGYNRVEARLEPAGWRGVKHKATLDPSGDLKFKEDSGPGGPPSYVMVDPLDLGGVFTVRLSLEVDGSAFIEDMFDDRTNNIDEWLAFDGEAPGGLSLRYDVSVTQSDPTKPGAVWSDWRQFLVGEFRGWAFQIRVSLWNSQDFAAGGLASLTLLADVPDRIERGQVGIFARWNQVVYLNPFMKTPHMALTVKELEAGYYHQIRNPTNKGFEIGVFDSEGAHVLASADWISTGYGTADPIE